MTRMMPQGVNIDKIIISMALPHLITRGDSLATTNSNCTWAFSACRRQQGILPNVQNQALVSGCRTGLIWVCSQLTAALPTALA